jgi:hypothetical protein
MGNGALRERSGCTGIERKGRHSSEGWNDGSLLNLTSLPLSKIGYLLFFEP